MNCVKDMLEEFIDEVERRNKCDGLTGIASGFVDLDRITGGWNKEELIFVVSVPGMGTTELLNNFCMNALKSREDIRIAFFAPILSDFKWLSQMISSEGKVEYTRIKKGDLREDDRDRIIFATRKLNELGKRLFQSSKMFLTLEEIRLECSKLKNDGLDIVFINDFHSIIGENRAYELKKIAKEFSISIICGVFLETEKINTRPDKRPRLEYLPKNEKIEHIADHIILLYRHPFYYPEEDDILTAELLVWDSTDYYRCDLVFLQLFCCFHHRLED